MASWLIYTSLLVFGGLLLELVLPLHTSRWVRWGWCGALWVLLSVIWDRSKR
jgi:hypothetical protein